MNKINLVLITLVFTLSSVSARAVQVSTLKLDGVATVNFNALIQGWSTTNSQEGPNDQYVRLRRSEMKISGKIADHPKYFLMVDPAKLIKPKGSSKDIPTDVMFQDFGMSYEVLSGLEITAGQFKIPGTAEALDSSSELILPERSLMTRTFGEKREIGGKIAYKTEQVTVATMVSMGRAVSDSGSSNLKDLITRVEYKPTQDVVVGSFIELGDFEYSRKGRWGLNTRYQYQDAILRAEFAQAKDALIYSNGVNLEAGYWVTKDLLPVFRFEAFTPNQNRGVMGKAQTLGLGYFVARPNVKVQVAGSFLQNMSAGNGSPAISAGKNDAVATLNLQLTL